MASGKDDKQPLKVISYAFIDMPLDEYENLLKKGSHVLNYVESLEFREVMESDLIYLATFGLIDELRDSIADSVHLIKYGYTHDPKVQQKNERAEVNIRMMTGDHIETARETAV